MRLFLTRRIAPIVVLMSGIGPMMRGAVQNRITNGVGTQAVELAHSVPPRVSKASALTDLGGADGGLSLTSMTLRFNMTVAQKVALSKLLIDQQTPGSPKYHQWLTPEQFAAKFGLSSGDVATVSQWLTSQGFKITATARSRTLIQFSGTVAQAQAAFQTSIHRVLVDGEEHVANVATISLPAGIAGVVSAASGLDDFRLKPRARTHREQAGSDPKFTSSITGSHFIAPGDFYTIYDVKPLLTSSINGAGITIAVAGQTDIKLSDVAAFRTASGLSANLPTVKLYGADPGTPMTNGVAEDESEADLDLEWSGAVAPAASILYVNSTDVVNSLVQIIDNKLAPIASISYGDCESGTGESNLTALNQVFMQANAEGITVVGPAGDSGATDCDYKVSSATQGLTVDFPASSPFVTGVGGTMFDEGSGSYFGSTNDANSGSAISYIPETVWNEAEATLSAGGGGLSAFFVKPAWQTGTGVPNDFARDVPDLALTAANNHDGYLYCTQGSCVNGFRDATNGLRVVGGTSASTPAFAGVLALVQQKIGAATANANPVIYALANSTYSGMVFHDVTTGNNASPCTAGSTDCPSGGSIGYSAGVGYDLASGWGSVDAFNLANSWTLVTPLGVGSAGNVASSTTVAASSASVTSGAMVTFTATVANASSAPVSSGGPTGTVQLLVDNVASGGPVNLVSNGIGTLSAGVTFSLATTGLASGNHVISAAYSGDTVYAGSKGSVTIDVISASAADFMLTQATATVTTKSGTDAPGLVFTVTPVNGFTGNVAFTSGTTSSTLQASADFSVTPVMITSSAAGTTTLKLSAYVLNGQAIGSTGKVRLGSASAVAPRGVRSAWYARSGMALACFVLLMLPRRRTTGSLLGAVIAVAVLGGMLGMTGCGSGSSNIATSTNSAPGTYTINVSASGTNAAGVQQTHNSTVTFVVQ